MIGMFFGAAALVEATDLGESALAEPWSAARAHGGDDHPSSLIAALAGSLAPSLAGRPADRGGRAACGRSPPAAFS